MKLLVVIANYRVADLTVDCLRSIAKEIGSVPGMRVAVCENGTGDDIAEQIQNAITESGWNTWCTVTAVSPNLGFTGGNNVILEPALQATTPPQYVLLLNADTIVQRNAFRVLVDFMDQHPSVGIAGSGLEYPDRAPQRSAFRFHTPLSEFNRSLSLGLVSQFLKRWEIAPPLPDHACEVDWVGGASMIISREVFDKIGLLDQGYYTHYEDVDFCFNARKAGWSVWYVPDSRVTHFVGQSTGLTVKNPKRHPSYFFEARRRYFLKNRGPFYASLADAALIFGLTLWRVRVMLGKPDSNAPCLLRDTIRHSVFLTGFRVTDVENPALADASLGKEARARPRRDS